MPELPDVEVARRLAERTGLRREIRDVVAPRSRVLGPLTAKALRDAVRGRSFRGTDRHGKHLLLKLSGDGVVGMHFGLNGWLDIGDGEAPASTRVAFAFADGGRLAVVDPRQFGRVGLAADKTSYVAEHGLGPDALALERPAFLSALAERRGALKPLLMDQGLVAGIGNVYADEILFHARLHPQRRLESLDERDRSQLHRSLHRVLVEAIEHDADRAHLPAGWLTPLRAKGGACPRCGTTLASGTVGGRTTWWCPTCQIRG